MKTENTIIIHPETIEQENALKAFAKALKMKFEVPKKNPCILSLWIRSRKAGSRPKRGK